MYGIRGYPTKVENRVALRPGPTGCPYAVRLKMTCLTCNKTRTEAREFLSILENWGLFFQNTHFVRSCSNLGKCFPKCDQNCPGRNTKHRPVPHEHRPSQFRTVTDGKAPAFARHGSLFPSKRRNFATRSAHVQSAGRSAGYNSPDAPFPPNFTAKAPRNALWPPSASICSNQAPQHTDTDLPPQFCAKSRKQRALYFRVGKYGALLVTKGPIHKNVKNSLVGSMENGSLGLRAPKRDLGPVRGPV